MRAVSSGLDGQEFVFGREQLDLLEMPAVKVVGEGELGPSWAMRWRLTDEERERIAEGEDLVVIMPGTVYPYQLKLWGDAFDDDRPPEGWKP